MNIGMLWFDNDPETELTNKIEQAASYYQKKYGQAPNQCMVNPSMLEESSANSSKVKVSSNPTVLPNHLWIGYNTSLNGRGSQSGN